MTYLDHVAEGSVEVSGEVMPMWAAFLVFVGVVVLWGLAYAWRQRRIERQLDATSTCSDHQNQPSTPAGFMPGVAGVCQPIGSPHGNQQGLLESPESCPRPRPRLAVPTPGGALSIRTGECAKDGRLPAAWYGFAPDPMPSSLRSGSDLPLGRYSDRGGIADVEDCKQW